MSTGDIGSFFQNSFYVGNTFNAILYGVELVLYFQTMSLLYKGRKHHRSDTFFMTFSTVLLLCITVFVATQSIIGQEMWVVHQDWPGGSSAYLSEYASVWYETLGSAASIFLQLISDALLIFRCWTIWCGNWKIIIFPCILWLATLAFGVLELYTSGSPSANFFAGFAAHVGLVYFTLTISLNVLTTSIICFRIFSYAHMMRTMPLLDPGTKRLADEFASTYVTFASLVVESALPYTLCGIAFLVAFGMGSACSVLFLSLYGMFTCVSPQMLILRVAQGRAWTIETGTQHLTTIAFQVTSEPSLDGETAVAQVRDVVVGERSENVSSAKEEV